MRKQILTFVAVLVAFGAAWLGRDLAARPDVRVPGAPALASVVPLKAWRLPARAVDAQDLEPSVPLSDSVGVLLPRHYGAPPVESSEPAGIDDYYLYLPEGVERGRWPVILYLHGRSLRGNDLSMLTRYGLPRYLDEGRDIPFIVVAPQLSDGHSWTDTQRIADLLDDVLERYPADPNRVYLTGYSMGGGGVWRMALAHPGRFAAAAPVAALTPAPSEAWTLALARLPVRVYHGTADEAAPFAGAAAMVSSLRAAGLDAELRAYEGARHGDLTRVYGDSDLYDWFLAHRLSR